MTGLLPFLAGVATPFFALFAIILLTEERDPQGDAQNMSGPSHE